MVKITRLKLWILLPALLAAAGSFAAVYDNRFIPLMQPLRLKPNGFLSSWFVQPFLATGSLAIDDNDSQREIGIPEIFGRLDEGILGNAIARTGKPNPLPTEWVGRSIPLNAGGKLQFEGVAISVYQQMCDWFFAGFSCLFMRANGRNEFTIRDKADSSGGEYIGVQLTPEERAQLGFSLRQMFIELALRENQSSQNGFGDTDLFIAAHKNWDFCAKFRRIDLDMFLGLLVPTGARQLLDVPSSVPFGGDGFWGIYLEADALFEVREDIKFSLRGRVSKRLSRTRLSRIPVLGEPSIFGATVGQVHCKPGWTYVFSPTISFEHLRKGLGFAVGYTLTHHSKDTYQDRRPLDVQAALPVKIDDLTHYSSWGTDYFTVSVLYELDWLCNKEKLTPNIWFKWEIPSTLWATSRSVKTHLVSLGLEIAF